MTPSDLARLNQARLFAGLFDTKRLAFRDLGARSVFLGERTCYFVVVYHVAYLLLTGDSGRVSLIL